MIRVMLDSHIYDALDADVEMQISIASKVGLNSIEIIVSPTIIHEMSKSPFRGVPDFFPVVQVSEAVAICGHAIVGLCRISEGMIYKAHLGKSKKARDAMITETAEFDCGIFVSDDKRCRERFKRVATNCKAMDFNDFKKWLSLS